MGFFSSFKLAVKGLATSKMRAFLTMLGIIIGVSAVIIIMSLGNGMQKAMLSSFESLGTNTLSVNLVGRGSTRTVSVDDMYELFEQNTEYFKAMSPTVSVGGTAKYQNETLSSTITGVGEHWLDTKSYEMAQGRFLQYIDIARRQNVCVVGAYLNGSELYNGNALGSTIKINGNNYTIVGVLAEISDAMDENGNDNTIVIPYSNATILSRNANISSYTFTGANEDTIDIAKDTIERFLYKEYGNDNAYLIISMSEMLDELTALTDTFVIVLAAIAAISLLVGGIGIMNIMLVSVTERTREIGIRKALGARQKDIRGQFVIEAATTSAIGGIIGIALGAVLSQMTGDVISNLMSSMTIDGTPTITSIAVSFGVSVFIGILFGFLPANKAAKLNPIDALRYD